MFSKSALVLTTAVAIAITSFDLRPAAAAPQGAPAIAKQQSVELSAARKKRRHRGNAAFPLAAFGMIAGTIANIAASERRREYYERQYYGGPYGYGAPYVYDAPYASSGFGPPLAAGPAYTPHGYRAYQRRLGPPSPPMDNPGH